MDELKFRRQAYADPHHQSPEFIKAIKEDPKKAAFINELNNLDQQIESALNIDVPSDLSDKLLLNQQLLQHQGQRKKAAFTVALAASIAFIAGISFILFRLGPVDLSAYALAHVHHENKALTINGNIPYQDVNTKLASLTNLSNAKFTQQPGKVFYSTYCDFQGVKSLHLVMQGEQGKVTLFIVPMENRMQLQDAFADSKLKGLGFKIDNAYMLIVGDNNKDINYVKNEIKQSFI
ncbi:DUF3379 domain-containing protein [Shewanella surugensis]|uniref:DUF3379 domain-containing protein n=1 Tax=Shewanella surugensis TaxID=212020 RepID=A0ABT0LIS8_9GAMM|nr:DUF3379 domain-containing protein [Shewanella surugensis]MCL1127365.1 DUF3379 domain-containing protein [Shewanella surugensis]